MDALQLTEERTFKLNRMKLGGEFPYAGTPTRAALTVMLDHIDRLAARIERLERLIPEADRPGTTTIGR